MILLVYLQMAKVVFGNYLRFADKVHHVDNICEAFSFEFSAIGQG